MPIMITIEPNPDFKASKEDKAVFEEVKKSGEKKVAQVTGFEAVKNSRGMYRIKDEATPPPTAPERRLEDMSDAEIKMLYFQMGGKAPTGKQMQRTAVIDAIRLQMDQLIIAEDTPADDE
jgi:hypothetical protein